MKKIITPVVLSIYFILLISNFFEDVPILGLVLVSVILAFNLFVAALVIMWPIRFLSAPSVMSKMKAVIIIVYTLLLLLNLLLMIVSMKVAPELSWAEWFRPDHIAITFIFMVFLLISILLVQFYNPFLPIYLLQFTIAGTLLYLSAIYHAFPEKSIFWGVLHLITAISFTCWNFLSLNITSDTN